MRGAGGQEDEEGGLGAWRCRLWGEGEGSVVFAELLRERMV